MRYAARGKRWTGKTGQTMKAVTIILIVVVINGIYTANGGHLLSVVSSTCIVCGIQGQDLEGFYTKDWRSKIEVWRSSKPIRDRKSAPNMAGFDFEISSENHDFFDPILTRLPTLKMGSLCVYIFVCESGRCPIAAKPNLCIFPLLQD